MNARTPGPWTVVPSAVSQRFDLRNESTGLIWNRALKNSAACELAATKNEVERLTAQRDALAEVLRGLISDPGDEDCYHCGMLDNLRAALAKGGSE